MYSHNCKIKLFRLIQDLHKKQCLNHDFAVYFEIMIIWLSIFLGNLPLSLTKLCFCAELFCIYLWRKCNSTSLKQVSAEDLHSDLQTFCPWFERRNWFHSKKFNNLFSILLIFLLDHRKSVDLAKSAHYNQHVYYFIYLLRKQINSHMYICGNFMLLYCLDAASVQSKHSSRMKSWNISNVYMQCLEFVFNPTVYTFLRFLNCHQNFA